MDDPAIRIGLPIGLQLMAEIGVFALVGLLAGHLGAIHLAAHQLVLAFVSLTFTISVGVACYPEHGTEPGALLEAADAALYVAKRGGRDQVQPARPRALSA